MPDVYTSGMHSEPLKSARASLGNLVRRASHGHEVIRLTDHGSTAAYLIGPEDWEEYRRLQDDEDRRAILAAVQGGRVRSFNSVAEIDAALEEHDRQQAQDGSAA